MSAQIIQFPVPSLSKRQIAMNAQRERAELAADAAQRTRPFSSAELLVLREMIAQYCNPDGGSYVMKRHMVDNG